LKKQREMLAYIGKIQPRFQFQSAQTNVNEDAGMQVCGKHSVLID
jgi:hypothetical protein